MPEEEEGLAMPTLCLYPRWAGMGGIPVKGSMGSSWVG